MRGFKEHPNGASDTASSPRASTGAATHPGKYTDYVELGMHGSVL